GLLVTGTDNRVDENVWRATAAQMVPRAVDYAAGVLEHFFRGRIEIAPPDRFVYGLANYVAENAGAFTKLRLKVRNATPDEATGSGRLIAVVQYRKALDGNLIEDPVGAVSGEIFYSVAKPIEY